MEIEIQKNIRFIKEQSQKFWSRCILAKMTGANNNATAMDGQTHATHQLTKPIKTQAQRICSKSFTHKQNS